MDLSSFTQKLKGAVYRMTEWEMKADEATNEEPWGPSGKQMQELSDASYDRHSRDEIMKFLFKKFEQTGKHWRQCYKSLLCMEFIAKNGDLRAVQEMNDMIHCFRDLASNFHYKEQQNDHGLAVRERAKKIIELISSNELLMAEREKAGKVKEKFVGVGSNEGTIPASGANARNATARERQEKDDFEYARKLQQEEDGRKVSSPPTTRNTHNAFTTPVPTNGHNNGGIRHAPQPAQQEEWATYTAAPAPVAQPVYTQPAPVYSQPPPAPVVYAPQPAKPPADDFDIFSAIHQPVVPPAPQQPTGWGNPAPPTRQDEAEDFFAMRGAPTTAVNQPPISTPPGNNGSPIVTAPAQKPADKFAHLVNLDNLGLGSTPGFKPTATGPPRALNDMKR